MLEIIGYIILGIIFSLVFGYLVGYTLEIIFN